jgi:hypothetical protein
LVLDSTILENIPMESNHQLNWNITLSDGPARAAIIKTAQIIRRKGALGQRHFATL